MSSITKNFKINSYNIDRVCELTIPENASYFSMVTFQKTWQRIVNLCTGDGKWYNNTISHMKLQAKTKSKKHSTNSAEIQRLKKALNLEIEDQKRPQEKLYTPCVEKAIVGFSLAALDTRMGYVCVKLNSQITLKAHFASKITGFLFLLRNFNEDILHRIGIDTLGYRVIGGRPVLEELEFRLFFQHLSLKVFPKVIINRLRPEYAHYVDSRLAKIVRVATVALIFAVGHCRSEDEVLKFSAHLISALIYGGVQEMTGSTPLVIYMHILNNLMALSMAIPHQIWPEELLFLRDINMIQ